ncbi:response regulator [Cryobacterium roopkundense]|uniref:DNA-binding NarL/FixJ family response regulator n=1 Tax=Cryobacterium roopkundense TaxID=1001240 RepID=A0A7W8ZWC8_9MICO|nr:response regulator transcription factor [Cryobacterium roopkundense]MBB5641448.1 DNA-binding NarL/FixJ family response regulator [Cryobacterium roopkundense]
MTNSPVRVFILDDHELVRRGLRELLEGEGFDVVGEAGLAHDALRLIPLARPDVAILDARLADGTGIEVCRTLRSGDPSFTCLILTSDGAEQARLGAALAGAAGYVLKEIFGTVLIDRIHRAAAGETLFDPLVAGRIITDLTTTSAHDSPQARLTAQERRVLSLMSSGMTNREVGNSMFLAEATVTGYVASLLEKLGFQRRSRPAAAVAMGPAGHRS